MNAAPGMLGRDGWRDGYGRLEIFAVFSCSCGKLCAMANQADGNAAMVHATPRCERFETLADQRAALKYFKSLQELKATPELLQQLERETVSA